MSDQRPEGLPEDVLLIHYAELAQDASTPKRLHVLAAIGRLLNLRQVNCSLQDLCQEEGVLVSLRDWLAAEEGSRFWRLEGARVVSLRPCEKHILVGTRQLLDDLSILVAQPDRPHLPDLDTLWQAANTFIDRQVEVE